MWSCSSAVCVSVCLFQLASQFLHDAVDRRRSDYCPRGALFFGTWNKLIGLKFNYWDQSSILRRAFRQKYFRKCCQDFWHTLYSPLWNCRIMKTWLTFNCLFHYSYIPTKGRFFYLSELTGMSSSLSVSDHPVSQPGAVMFQEMMPEGNCWYQTHVFYVNI